MSNEWISVQQELPKTGLVLVVNDSGDITVGSHEIKHDGGCWRIGNDNVSWDYDFNHDYDVTHWMPLPSPPDTTQTKTGELR